MKFYLSVFLGIFLQIVSVLCQNSTNGTESDDTGNTENGAHSLIFTGVVIATATVLARLVN